MFLMVTLGFPLCCSSGLDQTVPHLCCCVLGQKQGSHPLFGQVITFWSLVCNSFREGKGFPMWLEIIARVLGEELSYLAKIS